MKQIPYPNELLEKFFIWFNKEKRKIFITTFILGFIANILVITNDIITTDAVTLGEVYIANSWDLSLGRWLLKFTEMTRFGLASSVVTGILSITLISFTTILLIDLFKIKNKISKYLISSLIVVSPFFIDTLLSVYCSPDFTLSFFLSVLSVYLLYNIKNKYISIISSSIALTLSLGLYQAYLGVTCTLCIMVPLIKTLKNEITSKEALQKIIKSLLAGLLGLILYEIILHILLYLTNTEMSSYGGANQIGINTILEIPLHITEAYITFYNYFMNDNLINNLIYRRQYFNILILIIMLLSIFKLYKQNNNNKTLLLIQIILSIILIPLSSSILAIIAPNRPIYTLMSAPFILIYIFMFSLLDEIKGSLISNKIISYITIISLLFIINSYFIMANVTYMSVRITKEKTTFAASKIANDIYNTPNYTKDTKVLFIGTSSTEYFQNNLTINKLQNSKSLYDPLMWEEPNLTNNGWHRIMNYYLGIEFDKSEIDDYEKITKTKEFENMNTYPTNYIKIIDDTLVVKIKEK